jgi:hypothetical protein
VKRPLMDWRLTQAPYTFLPTADHHWRDGLADFNLRANFLDLGGLILELCRENFRAFLLLSDYRVLFCYPGVELSDPPLLFLDFPVFFEELVEQHHVHCFVAHRVRFPVDVTNNQIRIYLFHFRGHESILLGRFGIDVLFVAESNGRQRKESIAGVAHRLHIPLETGRGRCR